MTSSFCAGLLQNALDEDVNVVNAEVLLRERGIELREELNHEMGAFRSSITASVTHDEDTYIAGATLLGTNMPRLIRLGEYRLEAYLDGILLIFLHDDVPGIIGVVGTILGRHQVNIAQMSVGRSGAAPGGPSIGVLNLDDVPPDEAIDEVLRHPHVHRIKVVRMPACGELPAWLQSSSAVPT